jgi:peptidoglycan/LPS O-acetylase OafA/YrhL
VLIVFVAHAGLRDRIPGNFGVTVFFFLSGYLITTLLRIEHERHGRISLRDFYLRRALRIMPPMYLVLAGAVALTLAGGLPPATVQPGVLALQAVHLTNYHIISADWWAGMAPGTWIYWSLAVEEHFYLVFPLLYIALRRTTAAPKRQALTLLAICGLVLAWRLVLVFALEASKDRTYVASDTRIDSILFGCVLAVFGNPALDATRVSERAWKWIWLPLGLVALVVSFVVLDPRFAETVRYTIQGLALIPLFVVAVRYPAWGPMRILNLRPVAFAGVLSYTIYLLHPTVLYGLQAWTSWPPLAIGSGALVLTLSLAFAINRFVERPCADLRRRLSRTGPAVPERAAPVGEAAPGQRDGLTAAVRGAP